MHTYFNEATGLRSKGSNTFKEHINSYLTISFTNEVKLLKKMNELKLVQNFSVKLKFNKLTELNELKLDKVNELKMNKLNELKLNRLGKLKLKGLNDLQLN